MDERTRFSTRHGFEPSEVEITVRHTAPSRLRGAVRDIAIESGLTPRPLRKTICRALRERENPSNWSEYPNIHDEILDLLDECDWYEVYDVIEIIWEKLDEDYIDANDGSRGSDYFTTELNKFFRKTGIGWQLVKGQLQIRGPELFEKVISNATETLQDSGRITASEEIRQALQDLSRRPEPDITGSIQHGIAALECTLRDVSRDPQRTLGDLIRRHRDIIPPPLDQCIEKAWGYASERGRHLREGHNPTFEEAELIVGIAGVVSIYLAKKALK
jgi:AbiJ N-terminal domain 4